MDGKYRLVRKIGQGGFGAVWMALETEAGRQVAIKVLHAHFAEDQKRRDRFFRGAREMARLGHSAIVEVLEPHGEQGGDCFFVMEYVKGHDFRDAIKHRFVRLQDVVTIIAEVGEALAHAHASGLIHRDVKPSNILLDAQRLPRLTDFDLVRVSDQTGGTQTGAMGTFLYTAPEVMKEAKEADETADIYSLAMTAVFGLYGKDLPMEVLRDAATFIDHNLDCNAAVKAVLKRAVTWQKQERYADAAVFCNDLVRAWETDQLPAWVAKPAPAPSPAAKPAAKPVAKSSSVIPPLTRGPAKQARRPAPSTPSAGAKGEAQIPKRLYVEEGSAPDEHSAARSAGLPAPPSLMVSDDEPSLVTGAGLVDQGGEDGFDSAERSGAIAFSLDVPASVLEEHAELPAPAVQEDAASQPAPEGMVVADVDDDDEEADASAIGRPDEAARQAALVALVTGASPARDPQAKPPATEVGAAPVVEAKPGREPEAGREYEPESKPQVAAAVVPGDVEPTKVPTVQESSGSSTRPILLFVGMVALLFLVFRLYEEGEIPQPVATSGGSEARARARGW